MPSDIIITIVYLAQEQLETFVEQIKASNLPKATQGDLVDLLKTARQNILSTLNKWVGFMRHKLPVLGVNNDYSLVIIIN